MTPTMISAGAVTAGTSVTTASSGENSRVTRNSAAVVTEVNPVRPPALTPAEDSMYEVVVEVPATAPPMVATASETRARLPLGSLPSSPIRPAWVVTPISVPAVSKKSTNSIVNTTTAIWAVNNSGRLPSA